MPPSSANSPRLPMKQGGTGAQRQGFLFDAEAHAPAPAGRGRMRLSAAGKRPGSYQWNGLIRIRALLQVPNEIQV